MTGGHHRVDSLRITSAFTHEMLDRALVIALALLALVGPYLGMLLLESLGPSLARP